MPATITYGDAIDHAVAFFYCFMSARGQITGSHVGEVVQGIVSAVLTDSLQYHRFSCIGRVNWP